MAEQRKTIQLLPAVNRTATLTKFFNATVDHLFQPENVEFLAGYVGDHPAWYNSTTDFYIEEPTSDREHHQIAPTAFSSDPSSGNLNSILFYDDLVNTLRFQGANVTTPERLFSASYYSWAPSVDLDMLINNTQYYWVPAGPNIIDLLDVTDYDNLISGNTQYTYTGNYTIVNDPTNTIYSGEVTPLIFTTGLKIRFHNDAHVELNGIDWLVCNVGSGILLQDDSWSSDPTSELSIAVNQGPDYFTMARGCSNNNSWSVTNRWFHISVLNTSQTLITTNGFQAAKPILQYWRNLELYNQGTFSRGLVDIVSSDPNLLGNYLQIPGGIVGSPNPVLNGITLKDGMLILAAGAIQPESKGVIYKVYGLNTIGECVLIPQPRSNTDVSVYPISGDQILSITNGNIATWAFLNGSWMSVQSRTYPNIIPLFQLYDTTGNSLIDPSVYPGSNFTGSQLFSYSVSDTSVLDPVLGINVQLNAFGDYVMNNHQATDTWTYVSNRVSTEITGYDFAHVIADSNVTEQYVNGWYLSATPTRQYFNIQYSIINGVLVETGEINASQPYTLPAVAGSNIVDLNIYVAPQSTPVGTLPNLFVNLVRNNTEVLLQRDIDYTVTNNTVTLSNPAQSDDRYLISSWIGNTPINDINGYYDIPWNLTNNPNNLDVTLLSRGEYLQHLSGTIGNQLGFVGQPLGVNNYRDTPQDPSLGMFILQHDASLLKLTTINSTPQSSITASQSDTDPELIISWAETAYLSFYGRFINSLFNLYNNQGYSAGNPPQSWITSALKAVNLGKSSRSPWANSGYDQSLYSGSYCNIQSVNPTWIPATGTRLGLTGAFMPRVYVDVTQPNSPLVIQTHDGAQIVMVDNQGQFMGHISSGAMWTSNPSLLTHPVAAAWLQFELNIYNNLPARYSDTDGQPVFNITTVTPGKWRTTDYSRAEYLSAQAAKFDIWAMTTQADATTNTSFNLNDQFSFNYINISDLDGQPIPGYWRGMYKWFYDTDRPDLFPWQMLGFSQQPSWWQSEYGIPPYTSGNTKLWQDLSVGLIRDGSTAGIHSEWARAGLMNCIPVDTQGNLLPPLAAGIVKSLPSTSAAKADWVFGDGGPVEWAWRSSQSGSFSTAWTGYLLKPAKFIDLTWDSLRTTVIYSNTKWPQRIYTDVNTRKSSSEFIEHRENPSLLNLPPSLSAYRSMTYYGSCGLNHWFSEYLTSLNQSVTLFLGNQIRGADVNLGHRFAGYVQSDGMRVLVDSFGQLGYASQIVPQENQHVYLYRSSSTGEYYYSGVVVQIVTGGYKVFGYDRVNPTFTVIPSNTTGTRFTSLLGNVNVTFYQQGLSTTSTVKYGTVFETQQQVVNFLTEYGRWLESQGWLFDQVSPDNNKILNWQYSASEFMFWSQGTWGLNNFIALSPASTRLNFSASIGQIQYVTGSQSGTYPIVDKQGSQISNRNLQILREDDNISIQPTNTQGIYGARLYTTTLEHVMLLDNLTNFGDIVYQPLYGQLQQRVKIFTYRTLDWDGRLSAPGYFLQEQSDNTYVMTSNFEKTANDFRLYYNIDQPKTYDAIHSGEGGSIITVTNTTEQPVVSNSKLNNLGKHTYGYQTRDYLQNLILEDATEFEFYQGYIKQKGSQNSITAMTRNYTLVPENATLQYFEEWALRLGRYGGTSVNSNIEFKILSNDVNSNPQWINLFSQVDSNNPDSDVLSLVPGDSRIVVPPESYESMGFALRSSYLPNPDTDVPSAGYVQLGETTWQVADEPTLLTLWDNNQATVTPVKLNDTVWQFSTTLGSWTTWVLMNTSSQINYTISSATTTLPTTVVCNSDPKLVNGDRVVIQNVVGVTSINGTYTVSNVNTSAFSFQIDVSTFQPGTGGTIWKYQNTRFSTTSHRDAVIPSSPWPQGLHVYVDQGDQISGAWSVYSRYDTNWIPIRNQPLQINADLLIGAKLYDSKYQTVTTVLQYFDPLQGYIPSIASAELSYKLEADPARYNNGGNNLITEQAWSDAHVGETFWDLSAVRYIDYHQGDNQYRVKNWGMIAPGTSIMVYEWIRSPVNPTLWAQYVAAGTALTQYGLSYIPSGVIYNSSSPSWTQNTIYSSDGSQQTWYYFWVGNSTMSPPANWRKFNTLELSIIISNPISQGLPWWAVIDSQNVIVANVSNKLSSDNQIMRIQWQSVETDATIHSQWQLIRPNDGNSVIDPLFWSRLTASLVGWDGLGNNVPDYRLNSLMQLGNLIRPRQTWFLNPVKAGEIFVDVSNSLIAALSDPITTDPNLSLYTKYFNSTEPQPEQTGNWDIHVANIAARDQLIPQLISGNRVLVDATAQTDNLWTIFTWLGSSWETTRVQAWNTADYWKLVDWYAAGYDSTVVINQTVESPADLSLITTLPVNLVVKVINNGQGQWVLYTWTGTDWSLIGQQSASIEILPTVYNNSIDLLNWDLAPFDSELFDQNASQPFYNIIQGLTTVVFNSLELNTLMFAMLNYVLTEQGFVDWITKTSFIVLRGFSLPLSQSQLYQSNNVESLLSYIQEIKPYRSKIREFVSSNTALDIAMMRPTDFDKPPILLADGTTRILSDTSSDDVAFMKSSNVYKDWVNNYMTSPQSHLVRELHTTIYVDRISTVAYGWDYVWDSASDIYGYSGTNNTQTWGGASRILDLYQPTPAQPPISDIATLMQSEFKGKILDSMPLDWQAGWNKSTWNNLGGWDPSDATLYSFLDAVISGGEVPEYDTFIPQLGGSNNFNLSYTPQDVALTVVWINGKIGNYGTDWIIPNWITSAVVVDMGSGYVVGDLLDIFGGTNLAPAQVIVTSINSTGGITGIEVVQPGSWDVVPSGAVPLTLIPYSSCIGINATVWPTWGGNHLVIKIPTVNPVYVLYHGKTFHGAPQGEWDSVYNGYRFLQPDVGDSRPPEFAMIRVPSSTRIDVINQEQSGITATGNVYTTDGISDRYKLGSRPINDKAAIVWLNGIKLNTINQDYFINYDTNYIVFANPLTAGQQLIVWSLGGSTVGTSVHNVIVNNPGTNYLPGGNITVNGSQSIPTILTIQNVKVNSVAYTSEGNGYSVGDQIYFETASDNPASWVVEQVGNVQIGNVTSLSINSTGSYDVIPTANIYTTGNGAGITFNTSSIWGIDTATVAQSGNWLLRPSNPVSDGNLSHSGNVATFDLMWDKELDNLTIVGDGITNTWTLNDTITSPNTLRIVQDGILINVSNLTVNGSNVTISPTPGLGSEVIIEHMETPNWSTVHDQNINVTISNSYVLSNPAISSKSGYASTQVVNITSGALIPAPARQLIKITNAEVNTYTVTVPMLSIPDLSVWLDETPLVYNTGFNVNVTTGTVTIMSNISSGQTVELVYADRNYGYDWALDTNGNILLGGSNVAAAWNINSWNNNWGWQSETGKVNPGDTIQVQTMPADSSWAWQLENHIPSSNNTFVLTDNMSVIGSVQIYNNGKPLAPGNDYSVIANGSNATVIVSNTAAISNTLEVYYARGVEDLEQSTRRVLLHGHTQHTQTLGQSTVLMQNVYANSTYIDVADGSNIAAPLNGKPGLVWIGNELIAWWESQVVTDINHPNRVILSNLWRNYRETAGNPSTLYQSIFHSGNGNNTVYTAPYTTRLSVWIGNTLQNINVDYTLSGNTITFITPPKVGNMNVRITWMSQDNTVTGISHNIGTAVYDGQSVQVAV